MNMEEEIVAFGQTSLWVECDLCGRAFGGTGVNKAVVATTFGNVCTECLQVVEGNGEPLLKGVG